MVKYTHILSYDERCRRLEFMKRTYINCMVADAMLGNDVSFWAGLLRNVSSLLRNMALMHNGVIVDDHVILRV